MASTKAKQIKQILTDTELREHALSALHSVQHAVEEVKPTEQKISKKAQKQMKRSAKKAEEKQALAPAPEPEPAEQEKKKRHPVRKLFVVATLGAIVALAVSEDARKAVLDALFGAEEEFQYTSKTASPVGSSNGSA